MAGTQEFRVDSSGVSAQNASNSDDKRSNRIVSWVGRGPCRLVGFCGASFTCDEIMR